MIIDTINRLHYYNAVLPGLDQAAAFMQRADLLALPNGRHEIDSDRVYALIQEYETKPREGGKLEAHRRYVDLQSVLRGSEVCGYLALPAAPSCDTPYNAEREFMLLNDKASDYSALLPQRFALLFPWDAHQPGCCSGDVPERVCKIVIKIALLP